MVGQRLNVLINGIRHYCSGPFKEKSPYVITAILAFIVMVIGINLFVELSDNVVHEMMDSFDQNITDYVLSFRTPLLTDYFVFVTKVGDTNGYLIILGIITILTVLIFKKWKFVLQVVLVLILSILSNMMLKRAFDRARPEIEHLVSVKTLSYPSGHAMSAMAFYGFIIYLVYKSTMNISLKILIGLVLIFLILSIGTSRIYLGVHFPSDVAGGFIAGMIWVFFCIIIFNLIALFKKDPTT